MQQVAQEIRSTGGTDRHETERSKRSYRFDIVDLYEEMLGRRAELGFRPVIYVSSDIDLECSLIGLYEHDGDDANGGEAIPAARSMEELRRRLR